MRIDIPLLPILVEVRWRTLQPFRVSIRSLMIMVILAALFFWLVSELGRISRALNYHTEQMVEENTRRSKSPPYGPTPLENWHLMKATEYRAAYDRVDIIVFVLFMATVSLGVVATLGRTLHWLFPRSVIPPRDQTSAASRSDVGRGS